METDISGKDLENLCRSGSYKELSAVLPNQTKHLSDLSASSLKLFRELSDLATMPQKCALLLAILHTVSDTELLKLRFWPGHFDDECISYDVLRSVPRQRLQSFAELLLATSRFHFDAVVKLYRAGLIDKPSSNNYVASLIARCSWKNKNRKGLAETLLSEPEFLSNDVWLLFKFDGSAENCLAGADKYLTNAGESWQSVLVDFSKQGILDRQRLLDESLCALSRDLNQFRAGWFSRFHQAMEPGIEERCSRLPIYLSLLASSVAPTVSFALSMILSIDKSAPISFTDLEPYIQNPLVSKSKQTVISALSLMQSCAQREPHLSELVCINASNALISNQAEIQNKVIDILLSKAGEGKLQNILSGYLDGLLPSVRKRLGIELVTESSSISPRPFPDATQTSMTPIMDLDQLVLQAGFLLEHPESYCEFELVLDGILRHCPRSHPEFSIRTSALLKRARKIIIQSGIANEQSMLFRICRLIIFWITDEVPDESAALPKLTTNTQVTLANLQERRLLEIMQRVARREPQSLLSLPSDEYGWLDSAVLKERLDSTKVFDAPIDKYVTLMRLRGGDTELIKRLLGDTKHILIDRALESLNSKDLLSGELFSWSIGSRESNGYKFTWIIMDPRPENILLGWAKRSENEVYRFLFWQLNAREVIAQGALLPRLRQQYFASGAEWLGSCLQGVEVADKAARHYLHFLRDPSVPVGKQGSILLVAALSTGDRDIAVAGTDAFIALISQERCNFEWTAEAMRLLFHAGDCIKANRWAKNFSLIAEESAKHSDFVYRLFQRVMSNSEAVKPKDIHFILELMVELQVQHERVLDSETVEYLRSINSSGKTQKLVEKLIARS